MAVAKDDSRATIVKSPRTEPTAVGCEKLAPFLMTAWKQAIWVWVALEKTWRIAEPSKSGIANATFGMPETSADETGIIAPPVMGTLVFNGHRLKPSEMRHRKGETELTWQNWHCKGWRVMSIGSRHLHNFVSTLHRRSRPKICLQASTDIYTGAVVSYMQ